MLSKELLRNVRPELIEYIENKIFPQYELNDEGHQMPHIEYVIRRCIEFSHQFEGLDEEICFVMAAYHDVGHHIDKDRHEELGGEIFYADEKMKEFFNEEQRLIIKEAIEDHRSTLEGEPRNTYGKILSSADRSVELDSSIRRTKAYLEKHNKGITSAEIISRAYDHIKRKYGKGGYAKTYVDDPEFEANKMEVENALESIESFTERYIKINGMDSRTISLSKMKEEINRIEQTRKEEIKDNN